MGRKSQTILSNTTGTLNVTGAQIKYDGYFGFSDGVGTVAFHLNNFIGRLIIEATLATSPEESDWFEVTLDGESNSYIEYSSAETSVQARTFIGNYVYVRAKVDRSYISPTPDASTVGSVLKVLLAF